MGAFFNNFKVLYVYVFTSIKNFKCIGQYITWYSIGLIMRNPIPVCGFFWIPDPWQKTKCDVRVMSEREFTDIGLADHSLPLENLPGALEI